ncbi:MAG: copper homeostasis periplasmic binding protein CopC [Alphaproteobacteria bacterium]|nr:copper homeostasis periplasmic binding protein CopC [Alphaproteobacteria bacterium]MBL7097370.1 copper homeostasis periplasmic binding protein CopC [Alphaproteobacteria bacterium]
MIKKSLAMAAAIAALAVASTAAEAHPRLKSSNPASHATLKTSPNAIRLNFSEGLIASFSGLTLTNGGRTVATGAPTVSGRDNTSLVVPLRAPLKPGAYSVAWHAVSVDTHRVSGSYSFKIAR